MRRRRRRACEKKKRSCHALVSGEFLIFTHSPKCKTGGKRQWMSVGNFQSSSQGQCMRADEWGGIGPEPSGVESGESTHLISSHT